MRPAISLTLALLVVAGCSASVDSSPTDNSTSAIEGSLAQARARQVRDAYRAAAPADFTDHSLQDAPAVVAQVNDEVAASPSSQLAAVASFPVQGIGSVLAVEIHRGAAPTPPKNASLMDVGGCLDIQLFDAMNLGALRTTRRTAANNTYSVKAWEEDPNSCTGCERTLCTACHTDSADAFSTSFSTTKASEKVLAQYFALQDGKIVPAGGIEKEASLTAHGAAYTHPFYEVNPATESAIKAFVTGAINKCNKMDDAQVTEDILFFSPNGSYLLRATVRGNGTTFARPLLNSDGHTFTLLPLD